MSIEAEHDVQVSDEAIEDLTEGAELLAAAHAKARELHPGYMYSYSTTIWCQGDRCGLLMDVPSGVDCGEAAAAIYEAHRAKEAERILTRWQAGLPTEEEEDDED